jgi:hypothetical protein
MKYRHIKLFSLEYHVLYTPFPRSQLPILGGLTQQRANYGNTAFLVSNKSHIFLVLYLHPKFHNGKPVRYSTNEKYLNHVLCSLQTADDGLFATSNVFPPILPVVSLAAHAQITS